MLRLKKNKINQKYKSVIAIVFNKLLGNLESKNCFKMAEVHFVFDPTLTSS